MKKIELSQKAKIVIASVAGAVVVAGGVIGAIFRIKAHKAKKEEETTDAE